MMLRIIFSLIAILLMSSCKSKITKDKNTQDNKAVENYSDRPFKIEDKKDQESMESYQVVENDQQATAMNKRIEAQIEEVEVQDRVFFGYDQLELSDEAKKVLDKQVSWLRSDEKISVAIEGHCDERGTREYNIALGERRAKSARDYLVANGIDSSRVKIVSYGKERPAFFGSGDEIFAKNRRAVTVINK